MKSAILCLSLGTNYVFAGSGGSWDYDHQDEWADDYSMCNSNDQSPIDIHTADVVNDDSVCTKTFDWSLNFTHSTFRLVNTGHTLQLQAVAPSSIDPDGDLSTTYFDEEGNEYSALVTNEDVIGRFPNYFTPWGSDHDTFCLDSFHFHWGSTDFNGSEHRIDGGAYPLELHFVHYSCQHADLGSTLLDFESESDVTDAEDRGEDVHQLGVVGIFYEVTNESNPAFDAIFDGHLDDIQYPDKRAFDSIVLDLNLLDLVPADIDSAGYFAYEGSLTTPPCTDIVRWHVMNAKGQIGVSQLDKFKRLFSDYYGTSAAPNFREIQDNVNTVYACAEGEDDPSATKEDDGNDSAAFTVVAVYGALIVIAQCVMGAICCWKSKKRSKKGDGAQPMVTSSAGGQSNNGAHHE